MDHLVDLGLPGLVFIGLCVWLVRKVVKAARTESDLEGDRLQGTLAEELQAARQRAAAVQRGPISAVPEVDAEPQPQPHSHPQPHPQPHPDPHPDPHPRPGPRPSPQPKTPSRAPSPLPDPSPSPLSTADVSAANPDHLLLIASLVSERESQLRAQHPGAAGRRVDVLWVRSNATHCAWCERRHAASPAASALTREVICVAQIERGKVVERWFFG